MENKTFERIQRSFNYTPTSIFTNQWSNLAFGVGMIIIPAIFPFGLRIRHLRILSPAVFSTLLIVGGVLLLFFTWRGMRNARALKAAGGKSRRRYARHLSRSRKRKGRIPLIPHLGYRVCEG